MTIRVGRIFSVNAIIVICSRTGQWAVCANWVYINNSTHLDSFLLHVS